MLLTIGKLRTSLNTYIYNLISIIKVERELRLDTLALHLPKPIRR